MSDPTTKEPPKKKGKLGKILMLAGAFVVLVGGGVGGGLYAAHSGLIGGAKAAPDNSPKLVPKAEQKAAAAGGTGGEAGGAASKPTGGPEGTGGEKYASTYYPMDKEFTANLQGSSHFIQVGLALSTHYDERVIANLKADDIAVRSAVLMALGDTPEDQVFTSEGKRRLQARIVKAINDTLVQKEGFGGVGNAYFTSFVVQ